jgi:hypothetical protein
MSCGANTEFPDSGEPVMAQLPTNQRIIDRIEGAAAMKSAKEKNIPLFDI